MSQQIIDLGKGMYRFADEPWIRVTNFRRPNNEVYPIPSSVKVEKKGEVEPDAPSALEEGADFCHNPTCLTLDAKTLCGRCELVEYCDKECQNKDWGRHRVNCIKNTHEACLEAITYSVNKSGKEPRFTLAKVAEKFKSFSPQIKHDIQEKIMTELALFKGDSDEHELMRLYLRIVPGARQNKKEFTRQWSAANRTFSKGTVSISFEGKKWKV